MISAEDYYVRVEKTISFKDLYSKVEIKNYQERSNKT